MAKHPVGVVYSTDPNFQYQYDEPPVQETLPPQQQRLRVAIDRHGRGGKTVTLVSGFVGTDDDLSELGRQLKACCGVGGSAKEGVVVIQGDQQEKVRRWLIERGYRVR